MFEGHLSFSAIVGGDLMHDAPTDCIFPDGGYAGLVAARKVGNGVDTYEDETLVVEAGVEVPQVDCNFKPKS